MNTKHFFASIVLLLSVLVSACAPSTPANPTDRFAGTWSGIMGFSDDPSAQQDIVVNIPTGCAVGNVCGDTTNPGVSCQWEMTLSALHQNVFEYKFSKTLSGGDPCEAGVGPGAIYMQTRSPRALIDWIIPQVPKTEVKSP